MHALLIALLFAPLLQQPDAMPPAGDSQSGAAQWRVKFCANCHGRSAEGGFGPDLAGGRGLTWEQFRHTVRKPWGVMLTYTEQQLPDQALADIYAFLKTQQKPAEPGHWHWPAAPASAPYEQRVYMQVAGCSQCHEPENKMARAWLGENAKEVNFEYFKKQIYQHTDKYPNGRMGNFSPDRLSEGNLREIYKFMVEDLGLRASISGALSIGEQQGGNTTYNVAITNRGIKDSGLAAEDVTIFVRVPSGTKVVTHTGNGYKGVQSLSTLGLLPARPQAEHPNEQGAIQRPKSDLSGDVIIWKLPAIGAAEKLTLSFTLAGTPSAALIKAFEGSTVYWEKPGRTAYGQKLAYYDTRTPDKGDHERIVPPRAPN
ncbi:MAG: cytochrome c [Candidatus Korobacteraceae bacterium]